jgi:RNA polymerase sigma factor (sigma-70 family)
MATGQLNGVLKQIRKLVAAENADKLSDRQLLDHYVQDRDEAAFTALVNRHGAMVLNVCRRVLHNHSDAEDACQATFLVLARKAHAIRKKDSVASWLHGVAFRAANNLRREIAHRVRREKNAITPRTDASSDITWREMRTILDDEIQKLPEELNAPVLLCCLEGKTHNEGAQQLGWSLTTFRGRLERARDLLRKRLTRRGVALSGVLLASFLSGSNASAALSATFVISTVRAAMAGKVIASGAVSATAMSLAQGVIDVMFWKKTAVGVLAFVLTAITFGIAGLTVQAVGGDTQRAAQLKDPPVADRSGQASAVEGNLGSDVAEETVTISGQVLATDGKPLAGAAVALFRWQDPSGKSQLVGSAKADGDGRFSLKASKPGPGSIFAAPELVVVANHAGFGAAWSPLDVAMKQQEVELRLPKEQPVQGRLVDLDGKSVNGAKVYVVRMGKNMPGKALIDLPVDGDASWLQPVTTDEEGRFTVRGLGADLAIAGIKVFHERYARQTFDFKPLDHENKEFRGALELARILEGVVTRADTGKPVAKARVAAAVRQFLEELLEFENGFDTTDDTGRFKIRVPVKGSFLVTASAPASDPSLKLVKLVRWPAGQVKHKADLVLEPGVLVRGTVTEAASSKPVAGARLVYMPFKRDGNNLGSVSDDRQAAVWAGEVVSGKDGSFITAVPPESSHLLVNGPTRDYIDEVVPWGKLKDNVWEGARRTYVHGLVPLVDLAAKEKARDVKVVLRAGVTIKGQVLGLDGKPANHVRMTSRLAPASDLARVKSEIRPYWRFIYRGWYPERLVGGDFELHGCDPKATYQVFFLDAKNKLGAVVAVPGKQAQDKPVTVQLAACGQLQVRVLDSLERPTTLGVSAHLLLTPGPTRLKLHLGETLKQGLTWADEIDLHRLAPGVPAFKRDKDGYRFTHLIPGATYRLSYFAKGAVVREFTVKAGETLRLPDIKLAKVAELEGKSSGGVPLMVPPR